MSLTPPALAIRFFTTSDTWDAQLTHSEHLLLYSTAFIAILIMTHRNALGWYVITLIFPIKQTVSFFPSNVTIFDNMIDSLCLHMLHMKYSFIL